MAFLNNTIISGKLSVTSAISEGGTLLSAKYAPISHTHSQYLTSHQDISGKLSINGGNGLDEGSSDLTDNTEILTSYASNNGFADTNAVGKIYKRDAIHIYNYVKGKLDSVYQAKGSYLTSHQSVSSSNNTASWGSAVTVGTVGGTDLKFTMPANPNTDHYAWSDITGKPLSLKGYSGSLSSGGWKTMQGKEGDAVLSVSYNNAQANWNSGTYSASLVFGCSDTRGLYDCAYSTPKVTFGGGEFGGSTNDNPRWYMSLTGSSGSSYNLNNFLTSHQSVSSSNNTASWGSAVTVGTVGGTDLKFTMPANPNTDHYAWSDITGKPDTYTPASHSHDYLPLSKVTSLDANNLTSNALYFAQASISNAAHTNHSMLLDVHNVGTPFQLQIPDSDTDYVYKRHYSSSSWSSWRKLKAGYADSAGSATDNTKLPLTGGTLTGLLTVNGGDSSRATIHLISKSNVPNDLYFGSNGTQHWSITSRETGDPYIGLYSTNSNVGWVWKVNQSSGIEYHLKKVSIEPSLDAPGAEPSLMVNYFTDGRDLGEAGLNIIKLGSSDNYIGQVPTTSSHDGGYGAGLGLHSTNCVHIISSGWTRIATFKKGEGLYCANNIYASSDRRLKCNFKKPEIDSYLDILSNLKLYEYNRKEQEKEDLDNKFLGLVAQDLRRALPEKYRTELVNSSSKYLSINEGKFPYLLLGGIQELSKKCDKLEKENAKLKDKNHDLEKRLKKLEKLVEKLLNN